MQWAPRTADTAAAGAVAAIALGLAATADPAGRLLFGLLAVWLAGVVAADLLLRPRLRADPTGVELRTLSTRRRLDWSDVRRIAVDERARYGLTARTLEVDAGDTLVLLGRRSLGTDPRDVADALQAIRPGPLPPG
jgi:hypothetical protein